MEPNSLQNSLDTIAKFVVNTADDLLMGDLFGKADGLADSSVRIIDPVCDGGRYLVQVCDLVMGKLKKIQDKINLLENHLIPDLYGFEWLEWDITKTEQTLHRSIQKHIRANYIAPFSWNLTTTKNFAQSNSLQNLKSKTILVLGNPPFGSKDNTYLANEVHLKAGKEFYKLYRADFPISNLSLAHNLLNTAEDGAIALVMPSGILDFEVYRSVRQRLYSDFDQIHAIHLTSEQTHVSILFLVKTKQKTPKMLWHYALNMDDIQTNRSLFTAELQAVRQQVQLNSRFSFSSRRLIQPSELEHYEASSNNIPCSLARLVVKNYKAIRELSLEFVADTQWIFLTGENAIGKSSVLQAIAIGLTDSNNRLLSKYANYDRQTSTQEQTAGNNKKSSQSRFGFFPSWDNYKEITPQIAVAYSQHNQYYINDSTDIDWSNPLAACVAYNHQRTELSETAAPTRLEDTFFGPRSYLANIEMRLVELSSSEGLRPAFEELRNALLAVLPNLEDIGVMDNYNKTGRTVYYKEKNGEMFRFGELSSGMRSVIAFVGDIIINLGAAQNQPSAEEGPVRVRDLQGIVLVDEFDNHLHPKWQKQLVQKLTSIFPKVQFIVSTHSPIPLLGAPKNSVFLHIEKDEQTGVRATQLDIDVTRLTPNAILSSPIFGFEELNSSEVPLSEVETADYYSNAELSSQLKKKLNLLPPADIDFLKGRTKQ